MPLEPRRPLGSVSSVPHGGLPWAELARGGLSPEDVIDFSVSVHPLGPAPRALEALRAADAGRYPDGESTALRRALAARHGLSPDRVWVGNGASEIIWLVAQTYLDRGDCALILGPTYGEYRRAAVLAGADVVEYRAPETDDFRPDLDAVAELARQVRPRLVFACNPNNPTGVLLDGAEIERLVALAGEGLLVLDEAYLAFAGADEGGGPLLEQAQVLLVRSMTKDFGIPGLRLGYALGAPEVIAALRAMSPPWSVNAYAQAVGLAALEDEAHLEAGRRLVREAGDYLRRELAGLGLTLRPSVANFWLVKVGDAAAVRAALLDRGIVVRDCTSFGLTEFLRLGARPLPDCERLVAALRQVAGP